MPEIVNAHQAEAWNGYEGRHWADHYDRYNGLNQGYNPVLLDGAGVGPGDRVLDVGCGTGQLTRAAARLGERATGIDLSEPMLDRARSLAEAEDVRNVEFVRGDAQVHAFPEGGYDVALSRFGVMFFADPVAAFGNIRAALGGAGGGGRLAFACLTDLAGTDLGGVLGSLNEVLPPAPPSPDGTSPASLNDPGRIDAILTGAGFRDVGCERVEVPGRWGRDADDAAGFLTDWGPVRYHLSHADAGATARARETLRAAFRPFETARGVELVGSAWLVTARA